MSGSGFSVQGLCFSVQALGTYFSAHTAIDELARTHKD